MREVLFRGKRIDNGEWVYGNFVKDYDGRCYITIPLANSHKGTVIFNDEKCRFEILQSGDADWPLEIHEVFDLEVIGNIRGNPELMDVLNNTLDTY